MSEACVICGHGHTDNACPPYCAGCDRPLDQVVAGIDAGCPVCLRFVEEGLEAMAESSKPPCLFPLPDGRRCCECDACHWTDE